MSTVTGHTILLRVFMSAELMISMFACRWRCYAGSVRLRVRETAADLLIQSRGLEQNRASV